jgi:hypothetical protein
MTKNPTKLEFVHQIDEVHRIFQDHLTSAEIYPHKANMDRFLEDLTEAKEKINKFLGLNQKKNIKLEINIGAQNYHINNNNAQSWANLIAHKEENFLQLAHVYDTLEKKIIENIQLENIQPYSKETGIIYQDQATMFIPMFEVINPKLKEKLQRVDYQIHEPASIYYLQQNIYTRDEALQFAQNVAQNCFYVLNASDYPLKETAIPLIGEKYKKIRKETIEQDSGFETYPPIH